MKTSYPIYGKMQQLVQTSNPVLFTMNSESKAWIAQMKNPIKSKIRSGYACGCDFEAGPIASNAVAPQKCNAVCANHGGWNRQWTTTIPGRMSVCGCNTCEISP
jgi:thiamine pyridinylase